MSRPAHLYMSARGYFLFKWTRFLSRFFLGPSSGVKLGKNVRLQKLSSLSAERPGASIEIGDHSVIYEHADIAAYGSGRVTLGERAIVGDVRIYSRGGITIGKRAIFSWNVFIQDFQPHPVDPRLRAKQLEVMTDRFLPAFDAHVPQAEEFNWEFPVEPVELGDDIWFGAGCTILPGAHIGNGSVVAAGAVVVRGEYPAGSILAGNPARVVKTIDPSGARAE